ncbi:MAG: thioredoxin domain-containing protein [Candidatus Dormibacteria bacterium]
MVNRLATETSPYLLQHADNPVDWYPWGDDAFAAARERDVPVLLSVGYSACHWCHVMAHECFENPSIAELMNRLFVNVKVDREERPDVDAVYMQAVQALSGHGGWPMTVFLTPAAEPFFGGTYFPPTDRGGMRGFPSVLEAVSDAWRNQRHNVTAISSQLLAAMRAGQGRGEGAAVTEATLDRACERLLADLDTVNGGFGGAPKFPHPAALDLLLHRHLATRDPRLLEAAVLTLRRMARGGLHDQLGGGFHRYAVDAGWAVPHFEKMLYDNAQLAPVYLHAFQLTGDAGCREVVTSTLGWMLREMALPNGGFASSQDADSPGGEGSYFVWTRAQLREALGDDASLGASVFGVTEGGNFEKGASVLSRARSDVSTDLLDSLRARMLAARAQRPAPQRDTKVITSWNALAIAALAECGAALGEDSWVEAAEGTADFLLTHVCDGDVPLRTFTEGRASITGFLEDSAYLASALVTLYEATGRPRHLHAARRLAVDALARFRGDDGLLYDTATGASDLVVRPRTVDDNPIPAGQSALANALLRLAALTGDLELRTAAADIITPLSASIERSPLFIASLACAADRLVAPSREVAIAGDRDDARTAALLATVRAAWHPHAVLAWGEADDVPLLADRPLLGGAPTAYVCSDFACQLPVTDPVALDEQLNS